jgi:hypothetical protein
MKRVIPALICGLAILIFAGCNTDVDKEPAVLPFGLPGTIIMDMAIDNNHDFYFITGEIDKYVEQPPYSSAPPYTYKFFLSRKADETVDYEKLDIIRIPAGKMLFDKNNNLLTNDSYAIYRMDGGLQRKIFDLSENSSVSHSSLSFVTVDNNNNIWTGGFQTGLFKIDDQLNVTHYHVHNSELPTNDIRDIYIDKNNDIWIALGWYGTKQEILKISNEQWFKYPVNTSNPNITSILADESGRLWVGTSWGNEHQSSLLCFDGSQWETVYPQNNKNEINGMIHFLRTDGHKLYCVSSQMNQVTSKYSSKVLTFDGMRWEEVLEIPEGDWVGDLIVDNYRQAVWVRTYKGIYKIQ